MTRLHAILIFTAILAGLYAITTLIAGMIVDFGISLAVCGFALVGWQLIDYCTEREREHNERIQTTRNHTWARRDREAQH